MRHKVEDRRQLGASTPLFSVLATQGELVRSHLELTLTNRRRVAEPSTKLAGAATIGARGLTPEAEQGASRAA
jgi:hypothetical protein